MSTTPSAYPLRLEGELHTRISRWLWLVKWLLAIPHIVILFFDNEDDYRRGDETLNAMPAADTPGKRTSVAKYQVAFRMAD